MSSSQHQSVYNEAYAAGIQACESMAPTPVVFGHAASIFSDEIDYSKPTYYNSEGVCGFAWVVIRPGNSSFARWMVKRGLARKHYYGGVSYNVRVGGQSLERKEAFARAFAASLNNAGIKAHAESRLD